MTRPRQGCPRPGRVRRRGRINFCRLILPTFPVPQPSFGPAPRGPRTTFRNLPIQADTANRKCVLNRRWSRVEHVSGLRRPRPGALGRWRVNVQRVPRRGVVGVDLPALQVWRWRRLDPTTGADRGSGGRPVRVFPKLGAARSERADQDGRVSLTWLSDCASATARRSRFWPWARSVRVAARPARARRRSARSRSARCRPPGPPRHWARSSSS